VRRASAAVLVTVLALAVVLLARGDVPCDVLETQPACQVAMQPGPTEDTFDLVSIDGAPSFSPAAGELLLTTVAVRDDLTWATWFAARRSPVVDAIPREQVYPTGIDREQVAEQNAALMADSQLVATIAALEQVGYELEGEGALVAAVTEDAVTDELEVGDVITAVDGAPIAENRDVVDAVRASAPGDQLDLEVSGPGGERTVEVTLGASPDDPSLAYVGVLLSTQLDLPIEVSIDAGVIGGPSAGMMFALSIVELLEEDDLVDGRVVAGTGTLDRDGVVGAVGGVRQKVAAAADPNGGREPASVFLVPRGNLADARGATVARDLLVVPVDTLDDALAALADLRAGREPVDALVLAADRS
jgi:PDZ domain-containing protein